MELTAKQLAEKLGVGTSTIHRWVKDNKIKSQNVSGMTYFTPDQVKEAIKKKESIYHAMPEGFKAVGWYDKHKNNKQKRSI